MKPIVTIESVAKAAGVGKGTVDRVLHNRGKVAPETRARVLKCIEELDYKPNIAARMLANTKHYRIAVCFHDKEKEFWDQVREGVMQARREYEAMGIAVEPFILPQIDVDAQLEVIHRVIEEKYDGLAIVPYYSNEVRDALNSAVEKGITVVTFNNYEQGINACYVGMNGLQSGRTAGKLMGLIAPQAARCAIVSSHSSRMAQVDERAVGFSEILHSCRRDIRIVGNYVFEEDYDEVYNITRYLLENNKADAIYATNECVVAAGRAVYDLNQTGNAIVIGHDATPMVLDLLKKGAIVAAIGQDPVRQGYAAVDKICRKLLRDEAIADEYTRISIIVSENAGYG